MMLMPTGLFSFYLFMNTIANNGFWNLNCYPDLFIHYVFIFQGIYVILTNILEAVFINRRPFSYHPLLFLVPCFQKSLWFKEDLLKVRIYMFNIVFFRIEKYHVFMLP